MIRPSRRAFPSAHDYWDGNWVYAMIEIAAGAFGGQFEAMLRAEEFARFRDELCPLYQNLIGTATFDTREGWLRLNVEGDGKGHFHAKCEAHDYPGTGNRLAFGIDFDQTELPDVVRGLDVICEAYPVVGNAPV